MNTKMSNDQTTQVLADKIVAYINGRRDSKLESFLKDAPKKNKLGEITNGAINTRLLAIVKKHHLDKDRISSIEKSKKTKEHTPLAFQMHSYQQLLALTENQPIDAELLNLKSTFQAFTQSNATEHQAAIWLTQWAAKAEDISFATHVSKLTHSSSKGTSVLDVTTEKNNCYLTTNSLNDMAIDTASANAASLPIADILKLESDGISVLDYIKNSDESVFKNFTDDNHLIETWMNQLKQAYDSSQKQSYFLSKQTYFPTKDGQYHLLLPLTSSSLVHALHLTHKKYWDEEQVATRKQKSEKNYSAAITITYPNKAYLHVTGSNHSNASSLNGQRGGRIALLPTMPRQWQSNFPRYAEKTSIFDRRLSDELKDEVDELKHYLLLLNNKQLSISEPKRNAAVVNKLEAISNQFFDYIEVVNANHERSWTLACKLPIEQQLLFEPMREDDVAKAIAINTDWQKAMSKTYGIWLNNQLKQKNRLPLTPIHSALWADAFLIELREVIATKQVTL
jgi:CRISPR-associated protein Csy1